MFAYFKKNQPRKLVENEIRESEVLLLQAHTNAEHWQSQISYHTTKLKRLRASWNAMQKEADKDSKNPPTNGKDTE